MSSIYSYSPYEFKSKIQSVHDKVHTTLYQVLLTFREGTQLKKTPELDISISKLSDDMIERCYNDLRRNSRLKPPKKVSLPYDDVKERARALVENIALQYPAGALDTEAGMKTHRIIKGEVVEDEAYQVQYPFAFEIVAIPYKKELLEEKPQGYASEFIGYINNSYSPKGTRFEGEYRWWKNKKKDEFPAFARNIHAVLEEYGFTFQGYNNSQKKKIPSIILGNLISPKILPKGQSKAEIDTTPFTETIIKAVALIAKDIPTFKAAGIRTPDYHSSSSYYSRTAATAIKLPNISDIVYELLEERIKQVRATGGKSITGKRQTQDSLWYNALPLFAKYGMECKRSSFKSCIRQVCADEGVRREQLGIVASPWASLFFEGEWHDVTYDSIKELAEKGTDIVFVEKRDIVQVLGPSAFEVGVALVNTRGLLVEYARELAKLAEVKGAHIAILCDYDIPGFLIASKLRSALWLGVNPEMLRHFGISHDNDQRVVPYNPKKDRVKDFDELIDSDERFFEATGVAEDKEWLKDNKVEIDAVLAEEGDEALWKYIQDKLEEAFPTRNYLRVIDTKNLDLSEFYPEEYKKLQARIENLANVAIEETRQKIESELENVEGFLNVQDRESKMMEQFGNIVKADPEINRIQSTLKELMVDDSGGNDNNDEKPQG